MFLSQGAIPFWKSSETPLHISLNSQQVPRHDRKQGTHTSHDRTRIDSIDSSSLSQLTSPCTCHSLNSSLGTTINTLIAESTASAHTANINNTTTAISGQIRNSSLHKEQRSSNIDSVNKVKVLHIALLNRKIGCYTSIVDDDVDLQFASLGVGEMVQCCSDKVCRTILTAHIGLYGQSLDSVLFLKTFG